MNKATQNFNNQNFQGKLVEVGLHPMRKKKRNYIMLDNVQAES